jgi:hypothetical protein
MKSLNNSSIDPFVPRDTAIHQLQTRVSYLETVIINIQRRLNNQEANVRDTESVYDTLEEFPIRTPRE